MKRKLQLALAGAAASNLWPNDPYGNGTAGWSLISDYGFTDALPDGSVDQQQIGTSGWYNVHGASITGGALSRITDNSAPNIGTPGWTNQIIQGYYPIGFTGWPTPNAGFSPFVLDYGQFGPTFSKGSAYFGFWFKNSSNWVGQGVLKMCQFNNFNDGASYFYMDGGSSPADGAVAIPYFTNVEPGNGGSSYSFGPRLSPGFTQALGTWHQAEMLWQYTGSGTGSIDVWCDGTHIVGLTSQVFGTSGVFSNAQVFPDYGGRGTGGTATGTQTSTTLQDTSFGNWGSGAWPVGIWSSPQQYIALLSGPGSPAQVLITANTSNTVTVASWPNGTPVSGSTTYQISTPPAQQYWYLAHVRLSGHA